MQQKKYIFKKTAVTSLIWFLVFEPFLAYAAPLQPDGSTSTTLDKSRNNVPIVNIASPNTSGLSHNKFTYYNIDKEGLILNNARTSAVNTQLGGYIYGNAQLTNNAKLILNEVTSTSRSALNGYTEIAGPAADLVIANPNGLTINGAGFINTNNVTLTTGRPVIADGALKSLNITGGDISIMGNGLNTQGQSSTAIYTQYLKLNAKLHAQNLNIQLGSNDVNYPTGKAISNGSANAHTVLLDTSALGGMYANRITLVGTDKGLGVNLPPEVLASTGDISIKNDGTISLQKVTAKQNITVQSVHNIVLNNNLYSGSNAFLGAGHTLTLKGGITAAKNSIEINSDQLFNQAIIIAGLNANNTKNADAPVVINSTGVTNSGWIQSSGSLTMATANLKNSGSIQANQNTQVTTHTLTNSGYITAATTLDITAEQLNSTAGKLSATDMNIAAVDLTSSDTNILAGNDMYLNISGDVHNSSIIQAGHNIDMLNAASLTNDGLITAAGTQTIQVAQDIINTGTLHAGTAGIAVAAGTGNLSLSATNIINKKDILSDNNITIAATNNVDNSNNRIVAIGDTTITAANLNNTNGQLRNNGTIQVMLQPNGVLTNNSGIIESLANATLNATILHNNQGSVKAGNILNINTQKIDLTNSTLYAARNFFLTLAALNNVSSSSLGSGGDLSITTTTNAQNTNQTDLLASGALTLNLGTGNLTNNSIISSGGALNLTAGSLINNINKRMIGGIGISKLNIAGNTFNAGVIGAQNLNLNSPNATVTNNGIINAGNNLSITATNLTNNQTLFSGKNMNLYTSNTLTNNAGSNIFALGNMNLMGRLSGTNTTTIRNVSAKIRAKGSINIKAATLDNIPGIAPSIVKGQPDTVHTESRNTAPDTRFAWEDTTTRVDTINATGYVPSIIAVGQNLNITGQTVNNDYSIINAGKNINVNISGRVNNLADLKAYTHVNVRGYEEIWRKVKSFYWSKSWQFNEYVTTDKDPSLTPGQTAISSVIQAASITGNAAVVNNGGSMAIGNAPTNDTAITSANASAISSAGSTAVATVSASNGVTGNGINQMNITLPTGNLGLFVTDKDPQGKYLIETNPAFTVYNNFISSDYLLQHVKLSPERTIKRIGDAFYENQLIRDSIFAQTGRVYLNANYYDDKAQYQHLMDNALAVHKSLNLVPGISLTEAQVAALKDDIVWLEEYRVAGETVLVPVVYIADVNKYKVKGSAIIAGQDIDLQFDNLNNSGTMEAGGNMSIDANDALVNMGGHITSGATMTLLAENNIENVSGEIKGNKVAIQSISGDIVNKRFTREFTSQNYLETLVGAAGSINATGSLSVNAGNTISIIGSNIKGNTVNLTSSKIDILSTEVNHFSQEGSGNNYVMQRATDHIGSSIDSDILHISSSNAVTIARSRVNANTAMDITASVLDILAVNDTHYVESKTSEDSWFNSSSQQDRHGTSTHVGSSITGGNIQLTSTLGNINIVGSSITANDRLALDSTGNINVQAGFNGSINETHTRKSGWFSGGHLFSRSEGLEGKLTKTAVLAKLSGKEVSFNAAKDMMLKGVDITVRNTLDGKAQNIALQNTHNEEKTWSKHKQLSVGFGDATKSLLRPDKIIQYNDGTASITLAQAEISKTDKVTTKTTVVGSTLKADNISLTAGSSSKHQGDVSIKGSDLIARNEVALTAGHDVTIKEAKNTQKTSSKDMQGTAELKATVRNEYVQISYAVKAAQESKRKLMQAKHDYDRYKQNLDKQRDKLAGLKAELANGKPGIEPADVNDMASLISELKGDDAYYKTNMALAATDLASKTTAVASQMAKAAKASGTAYGFSASLELDVDALVKQFNAYKEQSIASNVTANTINIAAGDTATVRGSNLNAANRINIAANDTHLLASQDVNTRSNRSDHQHVNISYGTAGGLSGSASADRSRGSSDGITNHNSQLNANNINITTHDTTTIAGANVAASGKLNIRTKHLDVASVQDSRTSRSNSQGFSIAGGESGVTGVGANRGMRHSRARQTVLTTLTGNSINIEVAKDTRLKGATIAAVDKNGNDNGKLTLKTGTLDVSSLNNTQSSQSLSAGFNAGIVNRQQQDHSNNSTLSTVDKSSTRMLNRDVKDNTVNIYNIKSHKGLKGSLDTRLVTKDGRKEVGKEFKDFGKNMQIVAQGLPEANNSNAIIAMIGKGLDKISTVTGGIIPSNSANGGLLGNIPVLVGDKDINHKLILVASKGSKYVKANPEMFIPIEKSDYFKSASLENQKAILEKSKDSRLYVSKTPISLNKANATYQNFTNGMMNTEGDAIKNGIDQTSSAHAKQPIVFTVNYNPTHGFVGDLLESAIGKVGGTTGIDKQTGEFINDVTTDRGKRGSNFTAHSQGNELVMQGIEYRKDHGGFKGKEYFSIPNASDTQKYKGIPTFAGYGSPVNTKDMKKTVTERGVGFKYNGMVTHANDAVGEVLGGNKGQNGQMGASDRVKSIKNIPKLFTEDSPHSAYKCTDNPNAKCGDRP